MYYRDFIWKIWFNAGWKVKIEAYASTSNASFITSSHNIEKSLANTASLKDSIYCMNVA